MKVKLVNNNGLKKELGLVIGEVYYVQREIGGYYYINGGRFKKTRFVIVQ